MPETVLNRRYYSNPFGPMASSQSSLQTQVDSLVSHFVEEAASPTTLAAMTAGGMAYRMGRIGVMGLRVGAYCNTPLRVASIAVGLGSEVTAFEFTNRSLQTLSPVTRHLSLNLWNWSGAGGWRDGLTSSAITFGMLRGAGFLAREQNLIFQHAFQSTAMVAGHNAISLFGASPRPDGTLAEQILHAEATNLQMVAGMGLVHSFAPGIHALERGLDLTLSSVGAHGRAPSIADQNILEKFLPQPVTEGSPSPQPSPSRERVAEDAVFMVGSGSGDSGRSRKPTSLSSLLKRLTRIQDRERAQEAFRHLSAGVYGPLQPEIARAMVRFEMGHELGSLIESLVKDQRIKRTVFLSPEFQRDFEEKIRQLEQETEPSQTVSPSQAAPLSLPSDSLLFLSDELLHSNIERYEVLKQILQNPKEPSSLTPEKLQREVMGLLSYFVRTSRIALEMADHDFLTGLYNPQALSRLTPDLERRLFTNRREGDGSKRSDWVIMLDIDHFKKVNDTYGHENGNQVLRKIAQVIKQTVRPRDMVARYGGEEIFIFLFNSGQHGAELASERIRHAIEQTDIPIKTSTKGIIPIRVTVSLGTAEMKLLPGTETEENPSLQGTLKFATARADEAMYQAKASGRNRVAISSK